MTEASVAAGASAAAIQHHYDVSNDFYALWLDDTMTYSAALWHAGDTLIEAQQRKLDWHIQHAGLKEGNALLDVGCGWGSTMNRALQQYGLRSVTGLTLSQQQLEYIQSHFPGKINAILESWADHQAREKYDAIISIGAFEHFANLRQSPAEKLAGYKRFFQFCHQNLVDDGCVSLQTITYELTNRHQFSDFFAQTIFPESDLPHLEEIIQSSNGLFEITFLRNDRHHYADTLRAWLRNLRHNKNEAIAIVGEQTYRHYERYLGMMIIAFHRGAMNLARIAMKKISA